MGDTYNFEEIGNFVGRVTSNIIDEDGDYITATHDEDKIKLDILDSRANEKLQNIYNALSGDNITINATFPSFIDISGVDTTYDASFNKGQLNVVDLRTNQYLAAISDYLQNTGLKITDSSGFTIDSTLNKSNGQRQLDVKDLTTNQYLGGILDYLQNNGLKITDSSGFTIDSTLNKSNGRRQLDVKDLTTNQYLGGILDYLQNNGLKITDSSGFTIDSTLNKSNGRRQLDVKDLTTNQILDSGIRIKDSENHLITGTVNTNPGHNGETKVYLDVYDENLHHEIDSGIKLTDTTGKIVTVTENIYPGYDGETKVYLDVYDENLINHIDSGIKLYGDSDGNIISSTKNGEKIYLDVFDENAISYLDLIKDKLSDVDTNIQILNTINDKLDMISNNLSITKISEQIFINSEIPMYATNNSPYSDTVDLTNNFIKYINIYGKFYYADNYQQTIVTTQIIVELSPNGIDWFESAYIKTITSDSTQNYFNININGLATNYVRIYVSPGFAIKTINAFIDAY
jgi:hypothetical protein